MCIGHMQILNYFMYMDLWVLVFAGGPRVNPLQIPETPVLGGAGQEGKCPENLYLCA